MASDWIPLGRRIDRLADAAPRRRSRHRLRAIDRGVDRQGRAAAPRARPAIGYPPELPVSAARATRSPRRFAQHQVVIVCGETGSGKTTQLPKICLRAGRGDARPDRPHAAAAHRRAQRSPRASRRSSAPSSATAVGYKVRFTDHTRPDAYIKLMTDGILLAETQRDRDARRLRHDHRRRGARAQPQHRFPARLSEAAARRSGPISS